MKVAVHQLSKPDLELPERVGEFGFNAQKTATRLQAKAEEFRKLLKRLRRLRRQAEVTQLAKNQTVEEHKSTFQAITGTLVGLYRLAGRDDLADRIRPSEVQRGRRAVEIEESSGGDSETSSPTPDGQPSEVQPPEGRPPEPRRDERRRRWRSGSPSSIRPPQDLAS